MRSHSNIFSSFLLELQPHHTNQEYTKASNECEQNQDVSVVTAGVKAKELATGERSRSK